MRFASIKVQLIDVDLSVLSADDQSRLARGEFCDNWADSPSGIGGRFVIRKTKPELNAHAWGPNVASREEFIRLAAEAAADVWDSALRRGFIDEHGLDSNEYPLLYKR